MADILIRGMEMPKDKPFNFSIWPNGMVCPIGIGKMHNWRYKKAIVLPANHGRLGDLDALCHYLQDVYHGAISDSELKVYEVIGLLYDAPTIIPAEGGNR